MQLGAIYKDVITGFQGVCIGYVRYLTGCNQALLLPRGTDSSKYPDAAWLDEQRLELVSDEVIVLDNGSNPGFGPLPSSGDPAPDIK